MNISNLSSVFGSHQPTHGQRNHAFRALANALQSGDLEKAQTAFAKLQTNSSTLKRNTAPQSTTPSSTTPATPSTPATPATSTTPPATQPSQTGSIADDFAALANALQTGDLSAAQQAFATLQQDLQKSFGAHGHHHHHHHEDDDGEHTQATESITINITINEIVGGTAATTPVISTTPTTSQSSETTTTGINTLA